MRLLTLPVTIVRIPVEFGFAAAKRAAKLAQGLVGGGKETVVEEPSAKPARRRGPARRSGGNGRTRTTPARRPARASAAATARAPSRRAAERPAPPAERPAPPAPPAPAAEPPADPAPAVERPVAPPAPVAPEPAHVSEEPEIVAETAESGAEDGAGAEVAVDEPWPGYDDMNAADIEDRLLAESHTVVAAVSLYEASRKGRASILEAASRSMSTPG